MKIAGSRRIAERYVKALFDVATQEDALPSVEKDMQALTQALIQSEDLQHFLTNPLLTRAQQAETLAIILKKMKTQSLTQQFIHMVAAQKRLPLLSVIAELFLQRAASERGELQGELVSAVPLKPAEVKQAADRLSKIVGKKVTLGVRQDPSLLGGIVIHIGSQQLDASLAGKIARLQLALRAA